MKITLDVAIGRLLDAIESGEDHLLLDLAHQVRELRAAQPLLDPSTDDQGAMHHQPPGPDTEVVAADLVAPKSGTYRMKALEAIRAAGAVGLTDGELAEITGVYLYTIAPRRKELVNRGWVRDSGTRRVSGHNRPAVVWVLTTAAQEWFMAFDPTGA